MWTGQEDTHDGPGADGLAEGGRGLRACIVGSDQLKSSSRGANAASRTSHRLTTCLRSPPELTRGCLHRSCKLLPLRLLHCDPSWWPSSADMVGAVAGQTPSPTLSTIWLPLCARCQASRWSAQCMRCLDRRDVNGDVPLRLSGQSRQLRGEKLRCGLIPLHPATASGSTPCRGSIAAADRHHAWGTLWRSAGRVGKQVADRLV